jgi:hypothetical protein
MIVDPGASPVTDEFQYDVAFSFVAQDEALATELDELLSPRVRTFLYSKKQEQLGGTDGEATFNAVFGQQSRIVVILHRAAWGETPWTRIEATAIRNRAMDHGYDFALFIPLDKPPNLPNWVPRNRLWIGLERWGVAAAAAVIEARIHDQGGAPREESLEERAARQARALEFKAERDHSLRSHAGIEAFRRESKSLSAAIKHGVDRINAGRTCHRLQFRDQPGGPSVLGLKLWLDFSGTNAGPISTQNLYVYVTLCRGAPLMLPGQLPEDPVPHLNRKYELDYLPSKNYVWNEQTDHNRSFSSESLAEEILKWYLDNGGDPVW